MENLKEINGVMSLLGASENFMEDYCEFRLINLILHQNSIPEGIFVSSFHKTKAFISSKISPASFFELKKVIEIHDNIIPIAEANSIFKTLSPILNYLNCEIIAGFSDQYYNDISTLFGNIVFRKDGEILCSEINIGDMACLSMNLNFPMYIRKEIVDRNGIEYENTTESISK